MKAADADVGRASPGRDEAVVEDYNVAVLADEVEVGRCPRLELLVPAAAHGVELVLLGVLRDDGARRPGELLVEPELGLVGHGRLLARERLAEDLVDVEAAVRRAGNAEQRGLGLGLAAGRGAPPRWAWLWDSRQQQALTRGWRRAAETGCGGLRGRAAAGREPRERARSPLAGGECRSWASSSSWRRRGCRWVSPWCRRCSWRPRRS